MATDSVLNELDSLFADVLAASNDTRARRNAVNVLIRHLTNAANRGVDIAAWVDSTPSGAPRDTLRTLVGGLLRETRLITHDITGSVVPHTLISLRVHTPAFPTLIVEPFNIGPPAGARVLSVRHLVETGFTAYSARLLVAPTEHYTGPVPGVPGGRTFDLIGPPLEHDQVEKVQERATELALAWASRSGTHAERRAYVESIIDAKNIERVLEASGFDEVHETRTVLMMLVAFDTFMQMSSALDANTARALRASVRSGTLDTQAVLATKGVLRAGGEYLHVGARLSGPLAEWSFVRVLGTGSFGRASVVHNDTTDETRVVKLEWLTQFADHDEADFYARIEAAIANPETDPVQRARLRNNMLRTYGHGVLDEDDIHDAARDMIPKARNGYHTKLVYTMTEFGVMDLFTFNTSRTRRDLVVRAEGSEWPLWPEHMAYQMMAALEALRTLGVTHRDIKPENMLLVYNPDDKLDYASNGVMTNVPYRLVVADFGLAKWASDRWNVAGTPRYLPPEFLFKELQQPTKQANDTQVVRSAVDVFAMGATLACTLSGEANPHEIRPATERFDVPASIVAMLSPAVRTRAALEDFYLPRLNSKSLAVTAADVEQQGKSRSSTLGGYMIAFVLSTAILSAPLPPLPSVDTTTAPSHPWGAVYLVRAARKQHEEIDAFISGTQDKAGVWTPVHSSGIRLRQLSRSEMMSTLLVGRLEERPVRPARGRAKRVVVTPGLLDIVEKTTRFLPPRDAANVLTPRSTDHLLRVTYDLTSFAVFDKLLTKPIPQAAITQPPVVKQPSRLEQHHQKKMEEMRRKQLERLEKDDTWLDDSESSEARFDLLEVAVRALRTHLRSFGGDEYAERLVRAMKHIGVEHHAVAPILVEHAIELIDARKRKRQADDDDDAGAAEPPRARQRTARPRTPPRREGSLDRDVLATLFNKPPSYRYKGTLWRRLIHGVPDDPRRLWHASNWSRNVLRGFRSDPDALRAEQQRLWLDKRRRSYTRAGLTMANNTPEDVRTAMFEITKDEGSETRDPLAYKAHAWRVDPVDVIRRRGRHLRVIEARAGGTDIVVTLGPFRHHVARQSFYVHRAMQSLPPTAGVPRVYATAVVPASALHARGWRSHIEALALADQDTDLVAIVVTEHWTPTSPDEWSRADKLDALVGLRTASLFHGAVNADHFGNASGRMVLTGWEHGAAVLANVLAPTGYYVDGDPSGRKSWWDIVRRRDFFGLEDGAEAVPDYLFDDKWPLQAVANDLERSAQPPYDADAFAMGLLMTDAVTGDMPDEFSAAVQRMLALPTVSRSRFMNTQLSRNQAVYAAKLWRWFRLMGPLPEVYAKRYSAVPGYDALQYLSNEYEEIATTNTPLIGDDLVLNELVTWHPEDRRVLTAARMGPAPAAFTNERLLRIAKESFGNDEGTVYAPQPTRRDRPAVRALHAYLKKHASDLSALGRVTFVAGGSQGRVYKVQFNGDDTAVAIKFMPVSASTTALEVFMSQHIAALQESPKTDEDDIVTHVLRIYATVDAVSALPQGAQDVYGNEPVAAIFMEYAPGGTLAEVTGDEDVARQMVRGVAALHARGIVHYDIAPKQWLVLGDDTVALADFGASSMMIGDTALQDHPFGTGGYQPPHWFLASAYAEDEGITTNDYRADAFALAVSLLDVSDYPTPKAHLTQATLLRWHKHPSASWIVRAAVRFGDAAMDQLLASLNMAVTLFGSKALSSGEFEDTWIARALRSIDVPPFTPSARASYAERQARLLLDARANDGRVVYQE